MVFKVVYKWHHALCAFPSVQTPSLVRRVCRVSPEDIVKCEEKFSKSKKVHQTVRHVAQKHGIKVDALNNSVIWPLYRKYGHALDALKVWHYGVFGGKDSLRLSFPDVVQPVSSPAGSWGDGSQQVPLGPVKPTVLASRSSSDQPVAVGLVNACSLRFCSLTRRLASSARAVSTRTPGTDKALPKAERRSVGFHVVVLAAAFFSNHHRQSSLVW